MIPAPKAADRLSKMRGVNIGSDVEVTGELDKCNFSE